MSTCQNQQMIQSSHLNYQSSRTKWPLLPKLQVLMRLSRGDHWLVHLVKSSILSSTTQVFFGQSPSLRMFSTSSCQITRLGTSVVVNPIFLPTILYRL